MANRLAKVVMTLDGQRVEVGLDKIREKTKQLKNEMHNLAMDGKQNTKEYKERQKAVEKLHKAEEDVADVTKRINTYMKELGNVATTDLRRAYREGIQLREGFKGTDKELQKLNSDLAAMKAQIDKNTGSTTAMTKAQQGFAGALRTTLKNLVAYMGVFAAFGKAKELFSEFISKNREFSDQMANVRKVSNLAMKDIEGLANSLSKIDSRTSLKGLMDLAYMGSKLGFGNYGAEGLESFAKSAVKVQNALSEDMGADAMTALSKMVEVMGLIPKMGVERAMDATGSAIFKLASTSTATGTNIVEFSKRLMGLANIAHITTPELLAIGSAADSMALMPEVAATAFNKLITAVQKQPNLIENALHIEKGTISDMYQAGKMTDALVLIFEKMREKGGMNALMQSGVFKDLGSDGARLVAVMATMANRVDMLNAHLAVSREAFEEGTAVAKEYAIQMDTAAAYSERAANIWEKAFVNPEGVDVVKEFSKAWYEVSKSLTENERFMLAVKLSLQGIILLLKGIMSILPELITMLMSGGFAMLITNLRTSEGLLSSLTMWFGKLTAAQKAFFKTAGWVGLALLIFEAGKAVYDYANNVKRASEFMKGFSDSLADVRKEQYASVRELDRYVTAINAATKGTKERIAAINNFNKKYGQYISQLLTEKSTALDVAKAYNEVVKQMKAKIALQAKEKDIEKFVTPRTQWEADKLEAYDSSVSGTGRSQYNGTWLKAFVDDAHAAGKSIAQVAKDLNSKVFHLSDESFANVYSQRGMNSVTTKGETTMTDAWGKVHKMQGIITLGTNSTEAQLQKALNYALQSYSTSNAIKRINKKYEPFDNDIAGLQTQTDEPTYDPLQDAPVKGGKNTTEQKAKEVREQYDAAKEKATGVIAKIDELYNLQVAAVRDAQSMGQLSEQEANDLVKMMEKARNESLMRARKAVGSGEQEAIAEWEKWAKEMMPELVADSSKWSDDLYKAIVDVNIKDLYDFLKKFDGNNIAGIDSKAFLDSIMKKGAENKKKSEIISAQFKVRTDKFLDQYEVIRLAHKKMVNDMQSLGLMTETYEEMAKRIAEGKDRQPKTLANGRTITDDEAYSQMGTKFIGQGLVPYSINIENKEEAQKWIHDFATNSKGELEDFAQAFPQIMEWLKLIEEQKKAIADGDMIGAQKAADELEAAMPTIQAMFYQLEANANSVGATIKKQVEAMTSRTPIGIDEMRTQSETRVSMTESLYDEQIGKANDMGDAESAAELERQKQQAIFDIKEEFRQKEYQIREQMGATWYEQYENEVAVYKNMLNKKLISEKEFQKKKKELDINLGLKNAQYYNGQMSSLVDALQNYEISAVEAKYDVLIAEAKKNGQDTTELENKKEEEKLEIQKKYADVQFAMKASEIIANTAVAIMQCKAQLGAFAAPAIAITAALGAVQLATALLERNKIKNMTVGSAPSSSSAATSSSSGTSAKLRLGKGMLTYDEGNVEDYADKGRKHKYLGEDGRVYTATEEPEPKDGLVTHPIATTVQGQAALVAEKGPEIVLGRKTTRAIMMNEPELIRYLANYQQHGGKYEPRRLYDAGNVQSVALPTQPSDVSPQTSDDTEMRQTLETLTQTVGLLQQQLAAGIRASINMYSNGEEKGLYDRMKEANSFMRRYGK